MLFCDYGFHAVLLRQSSSKKKKKDIGEIEKI